MAEWWGTLSGRAMMQVRILLIWYIVGDNGVVIIINYTLNRGEGSEIQ